MFINTDFSTTVFHVESEPDAVVNDFLEKTMMKPASCFKNLSVR